MPELHVRHAGWPAPATPAALPRADEAARGLGATDRALLRDGIPFVPVSGELHYSRLPRARWGERLRQLRAGGITLASTYVFWLHHVPERGRPRFDGDLDVAAFVDEVAAAGLELVLRIGPWVHGEARNGGFPDWVQDAAVAHRTDDPGYLALVAEWFGQLATALDGRARPGGPIVAIQLENELYDRPEHLVTLKRLAREAGISAPLWTATGWGGAELPDGEVVPLFSGYGDGFWVDPDDGWHPTFRAHFFPSHDWDDPGVGADVRETQGFEGGSVAASAPADLHGFPPATCELGSGMATAYHRRPVLAPRDVAALAHVKIGNGSGWQGYFMFAGGRNPGRGLQESHATGYPNDLPELGYDFHAPIGQSGDLHGSAALLRAQHAFLAAFGDRLGGMTSTLPDERPADLDDRTTLRWALRSDGREGFAVLSHHQPHEQVSDVAAVQLRVDLDGETLLVPSRPVDIPAGTLARWPLGLTVAGTRVRWITASAVTLLATPAPDGVPTLVVAADDGIPVEVALADDDRAGHVGDPGDAPRVVTPGTHRIGGIDLLVLPGVERFWFRGDDVFETDGELAWDGETVRVRDAAVLRRYDRVARAWAELPLDVALSDPPAAPLPVTAAPLRPAGSVAADYGIVGGRHSAPAPDVFDELAAVWELALPAVGPDDDAVLDIDWAGDVAQLRIAGEPVDDRFWDGTRWSVSLRDAGASPSDRVTLHVLPLAAGSTVWLPPDAAARRASATPALAAVDGIALRVRSPWHPISVLS